MSDEALLRLGAGRLLAILQNLSEGLMLFDEAGNLVYQNPASLRIHGFSPDAEGRLPQADLAATWTARDAEGQPLPYDGWPVARVFRGERFQDQVLHVHRNETGQDFVGSYNGCPLYGADGRQEGGFITIRDITRETRARAALRETETRTRAFFESEMMGALYWNVDGRITAANDRFLAMVGYDRADLAAGRLDWQAMSPPEYREADARALAELRAAGVQKPSEKEFLRKDGTRVPILVGAALVDEGRGEGIAFALDITERKQAEAARDAAVRGAEEASRQKDQFLAMLGHELRNPLAPMLNAVVLLRRLGPPDPRLQRARDMIARQVMHMTRLIDDLLDVSRVVQGKVLVRPQPFDLAATVRAAVEDHRPMFEAAGVALALDVPPGPMPARGDAERMTQVLSNLVLNALKFTPRGGAARVALSARGPEARLEVSDNGIGMEEKTLASLFQPFAQADRSLDRSKGGLGLGLALVRGIAEQHGGRVEAHSAGLGCGSRFVLVLPILAGVPEPRPAPAAAPPEKALARRVLIVEDNVDAAETLRGLLELEGHSVAVAHEGRRGLELARAHRPQVVLCDIGLPGGMDGYAVGEALRAQPESRGIRLIALTGYGRDEDRHRAVRAGFDRHLTKPVNPDLLAKLVADAR